MFFIPFFTKIQLTRWYVMRCDSTLKKVKWKHHNKTSNNTYYTVIQYNAIKNAIYFDSFTPSTFFKNKRYQTLFGLQFINSYLGLYQRSLMELFTKIVKGRMFYMEKMSRKLQKFSSNFYYEKMRTLILSLPVPHWVGVNTNLHSNSNISKMVKVDIASTKSFLKSIQ